MMMAKEVSSEIRDENWSQLKNPLIMVGLKLERYDLGPTEGQGGTVCCKQTKTGISGWASLSVYMEVPVMKTGSEALSIGERWITVLCLKQVIMWIHKRFSSLFVNTLLEMCLLIKHLNMVYMYSNNQNWIRCSLPPKSFAKDVFIPECRRSSTSC